MPRYLEFAASSNFSFLRGASHPEELMVQAAHVGLAGMGLADRNSVAGVVRAHLARREKELTLRYHPGARLVFADGTPDIIAYPRDRAAWGRLCRLLTLGNSRAEKGDCMLHLDDLVEFAEGLELVVMERCTASVSRAQRSTQWCAADPGPRLVCRDGNRDPASAVHHFASLRAAPRAGNAGRAQWLRRLIAIAPGRVRLAASMLYRGNDRARLAKRVALAREAGVPLIAINDVLYHHPDRRPLADVLTCIREHITIDTAGRRLAVNAERHLKPPDEMARLFRDAPEAIAETVRLSEALTFSLDELRYEYPDEVVEGFATAQEALAHLAYEGAARRYPAGVSDKVRASLQHELALIAELNYAAYFLTVYDIVRFARSQGILCQGRGSAANSAVCFCLGITEVDPSIHDLLFERFISASRNEPPDIDVDFEHERREEVIQYIYRRYGRERAGIAGTVISYRGRSAIREVGKAFGLSEDTIGALSSSIWGGGGGVVEQDALTRVGLDPASRRVQQIIGLVGEILSFPRHLSQHVGGFVITRSRLDEVVPIMNAAMEDRTNVEWDKDDLDALGILKVDVLGLGMLTCIRKAFELVERHYPSSSPPPLAGEVGRPKAGREGESRESGVCGVPPPQPSPASGGGGASAQEEREKSKLTLASIPQDDPAVYRMLCRADSLGVFQVESRAQMSMLPRLRPQNFYDLVIEVAIVRPGPIQGDMVHPYLRRRQGLEPVSFPSEELRAVLGKTLGVPLFQEQAMKIAIVAAGFTPSEADRLRRAMATFKRVGTIGTFQRKMVEGMVARGYQREFAERCFHQIEGFGEYGFPESHAASFALLVYASAWLKCHYPDVFAAALLNAQPMGFYAPAQIVRDVRDHGVEVRSVDVNYSGWDATLEEGPRAGARLHDLHAEMRRDIRTTRAIRLGLREVKGLSEEDAQRIVALRACPGRSAACNAALQTRDPGYPSAEPGSRISGAPLRAAPHPGHAPYTSVRDLWLRTSLSPRVIERLADADAFGSLGLTRRQALWAAKALGRVGDQDDDLPLFAAALPSPPPLAGEVDQCRLAGIDREGESGDSGVCGVPPPQPSPASGGGGSPAQEERGGGSPARAEREGHEPHVALPPMSLGEEVVNDYRFLKLSLRAHPASFLRADLSRRGIIANDELRRRRSGARVTVSGLVTCRQRPGSALGVVFMTIEDETALANIIVWPKMFERFRPIVLGARYVAVTGPMQEEAGVIHVIAERLVDLTPLLARLAEGPAVESPAHRDDARYGRSDDGDPREFGGRRPPIDVRFPDMADLISDLDVPARGSAHAPGRRAR